MPPKRKNGGQQREKMQNPCRNGKSRDYQPTAIPPRILDPRNLKNINARLAQAWKFLQDEDQYRTAGWETYFSSVCELLQEAEKRRMEDDKSIDFDLIAKIKESQSMSVLHRRFEVWKNGPSRFTTAKPLTITYPQRLAPYARQPPIICEHEGNPPSTYTSFIPRPKEVTNPPFGNYPTFKEEPDWKALFGRVEVQPMLRSYTVFYQHADLWGQTDLPSDSWEEKYPIMENSDNPQGINIAQLENAIYEESMDMDWVEFGRFQRSPTNNKTTTDLVRFAVQRGLRRAAIQKVLNLITNKENRDINTPWRRVAFPQPTKDIRHHQFHPWALARRNYETDKYGHSKVSLDRHEQGEPSPWIYWFNEWRQQANYLSAWSRQSYNKCHWNDFKIIALPVNLRGPYSFNDQCIYDDYWLKMGQYLMTLQATLEKLAVTHTRWLIERVVEDIKRGENGDMIDDEVIPRPNIDLVGDQTDRFQLIDEVDMAWLKLLCQPATTKALAGLSLSKPEDTLTVILDHRLQILFNDPLHNPFWMTDTSSQGGKPSFRPREMSLEHLLPILNLGGRDFETKDWGSEGLGVQTEYQKASQLVPTGAPIPNALYQFSLKEAKLHCTRLAEMGRIAYKRPEDPEDFNEMWWSGKGTLYYYPDANFESLGGFVVPVPPGVDLKTNNTLGSNTNAEDNPVRYPEERVRWRYPYRVAFEQANERQRELYATEMVRRNRAQQNAPQLPKSSYEEDFLPEIAWALGPEFESRSTEALRDSPAWEDILDYRTVLAKDVGYSTRTINFIRNLAYRMGRTIRHYKSLQNRTVQPSLLTRHHLNAALDEWKQHVANTWINEKEPDDPASLPFKLGSPNGVINRADKNNRNKDSKCMTTVFREIRNGIIDDMVNNKTMKYPSRRTLYTDKHKFIGTFYERANLWSWGSQEIRERNAVYRRERYFDMRRWPVNRQSKESTRTSITSRTDEDPNIQPVSAFYKYNIKVGPVRMVLEHSDVFSQLVAQIKDPDKMIVARQLIQHFSKELVKIVENVDNGFDTNWEITVAPPGAKTSGTKVSGTKTTRTRTASTKISTSSNNNNNTRVTAITGTAQTLKEMVRPKQKFIPGTAMYSMGDTLLQQVMVGQEIEDTIRGRKNDSIRDSILGPVREWIFPPPRRIPLLPSTNLAKTPSAVRQNLKRKVGTAFISSDGRAPKRQIVHGICDLETDGPSGEVKGTKRVVTLLDSNSDRTDGDSDFDYIIPNPGSSKNNKEDGKWVIKIEPDPKNVKKFDIAKSNTRDATQSGGHPVIHRNLNEPLIPAQKPNAKVRQSHVNSPIIGNTTEQDIETTLGNTSGSRQNTVIETRNSTSAGTSSMSKAAAARVQRMTDEFNKSFPRGCRAISTSGNQLLCALYAIIGSMEHQHPQERAPTIQELWDHHRYPQDKLIRAQKDVAFGNDNDLSIDQTTAALYDWGLLQGKVWQLGVYMPNGGQLYLIMDVHHSPADGVIWIQNGGSQEDLSAMIKAESDAASSKGGNLTIAELQTLWQGAPTNHYEALCPI